MRITFMSLGRQRERLCFNDTVINTDADKTEKKHLEATARTLTVPRQ